MRADPFFAGRERSRGKLSQRDLDEANERQRQRDRAYRFGDGAKMTPFGPRGSRAGLAAQLARGCPRCGRDVIAVDVAGMAAIKCKFCPEIFRAATGESFDEILGATSVAAQ